MDVCPRVSVLCCPVSVEALRRADPPSKESYQSVSICRSRSPLEKAKVPRRTVSAFLKKMIFQLLVSVRSDVLYKYIVLV
jgi:hypothetical protein